MSCWTPCITKGWELRLWFGETTENGFEKVQLAEVKEKIELQVNCEKGCIKNEGNHIQIRALEKSNFYLEIEVLTFSTKKIIGKVIFEAEEFTERGLIVRPILFDGKRVGKIEIGYILFNAFKEEIDKPIEINLKNKIIGHRGFGATNKNIKKNAVVIENTLNAFLSSSRLHTDFVEFDVQLTLDKVPIIHHDLWLQLKTTDFLGHPQVIRVPVNKLTYEQIRKLRPIVLDHSYYERYLKSHNVSINTKLTQPSTVDDMEFENRLKIQEEMELAAAQLIGADPKSSIYEFKEIDSELVTQKSKRKVSEFQSNIPTFAELLQMIPEEVGFDIEIKYCNCDEEGKILGYMERNEYLNRILEDVFKYGGNRKMFFSSFDPDSIALLHKKQSKYPALLLTTGKVDKHVTDTRRHSLLNAINFATRHGIKGVVSDAKAVLAQPDLINLAHQNGLILLTYGDENDDMSLAKKQYELGVDSLCTNRIVDIGLPITQKMI